MLEKIKYWTVVIVGFPIVALVGFIKEVMGEEEDEGWD